jgi:serine protease Do
MRVGVGIAALAALVPLVLPGGRAAEPTEKELLAAFQKQLRAVSESAGPSVVCVVVSRSDAYPKPASPDRPGRLGGFDPGEFLKADPSPARAGLARRLDLSDPGRVADHGSGGGVVIEPAGLVLVNYHTIEDATKVFVHLPGGKGAYANVHAADKRSDLAVLKLLAPPPGLKPIRFADVRTVDTADGRPATVFRGKLAVVLAHAAVTGFGVDHPGAGFGGISNVRRRPAANRNVNQQNQQAQTVYDFGTFLEYDTRPAFGGSGGALLNLDGELVGLTTALAAVTETGPGYALPMDANTRRIVEVLRRGEEVEYGFIGVVPANVAAGVLIQSISTQGPAQLAGLRTDDVITRVDDVPVADQRDLFLTVGTALAGSKVRVRVMTSNRPREVEVTLAKYHHALPYVASVRPDPVFGLRVEYTSVLFQGPRPGRVAADGVLPGVIVRELVPDSPAATKFKALGGDPDRWVVTHVDGTAVMNPPEFYKAAKGRPAVKLTLTDPLDPTARPREVMLP